MLRERALTLAGWLSAAISGLHIVMIFFGPSAYRYFGAGEEMARQAEAGSMVPALLTLFVALVFAVFALYALAGAGLTRRPPLLRTGLVVISAIYLLRGLALLPEVAQYARGSESIMPRHLVFSAVSLCVGILHLVGTILLWRGDRARSIARGPEEEVPVE